MNTSQEDGRRRSRSRHLLVEAEKGGETAVAPDEAARRLPIEETHETARHGGLEPLAAVTKGPLRQAPLGAVAQDLDEAARVSCLVPEQQEFAIRPEALARLADMPALVRRPAARQRVPHFYGGPPLGPVFGRKDPGERLTQHLVLGPAHNAAGALVPARHQAPDIGRDDAVIDRAVEHLPAAELLHLPLLLGLLPVCEGPVAFRQRLAQFELHHDGAGQRLQDEELLRVEVARRAVRHAKRTDRHARRCPERYAGVEAQRRRPQRQHGVGEQRLVGQVSHEQNVVDLRRPAADRESGRQLPVTHAHLGLEPLPIPVQEVDEGDGRGTGAGRHRHDVVEFALAVGIENVVGGERDVTLVRVRHGA